MANIGSKRLTRPAAAIGFTFMLVLLTANYLPVLFSAVFFIACLIFTIIAGSGQTAAQPKTAPDSGDIGACLWLFLFVYPF